MNEVVAMVLIVLLAGSGYAAGRLHGQLGYRTGYRFGYRQGYFDGDRSSWNRRRRELQAAVAAVLTTPAEGREETFPAQHPVGTTYTSAAAADAADEDDSLVYGPPYDASFDGTYPRPVPPVRPPGGDPREDWALVDARTAPRSPR